MSNRIEHSVNQVNEKVIQLWDDLAKNVVKNRRLKVPLTYSPSLVTHNILFVGMNPSFSKRGIRSFTEGKEGLPSDFIDRLDEYYTWEGEDSFREKMPLFQMVQSWAKDEYTYFDKFREISEDTLGDANKWEHVDLFFYHETNQKEFESAIPDDTKSKQLQLSTTLMELVDPVLVVVANAGATKRFEYRTREGSKLGELGQKFNIKWDEEHGYHRITITDRRVPLFLTSMLSGQHPLDNGSFRRLKWQIKKSLEGNK